MKRLLSAFCLCAASAAFATGVHDGNDFSKLGIRLRMPEVKTVQREWNGLPAKTPQTVGEDEAAKTVSGMASPFKTSGFLAPEDIKVSEKTERLDSIIGYINSGRDKYTRQYFTFDDNNNPVKRVNSYWNDGTGSWDAAEIYEYELDDDGYVLSTKAYSTTYGQRYDYEYNDKKLGISMVYFSWDGSVWTPVQRGEYAYDENGNITEELIKAYDTATSSWVDVVKHVASYDENNKMLVYEPYEWDGAEWYGVGEKKVYTWNGDNYSRIESYYWDVASKGWIAYVRDEKDFNGQGLCTRMEKMFYNKDLANWSGCYAYDGSMRYNTKSELTYDEQGRLVYEYAATGNGDGGAYVTQTDVTYTWTDMEDGGTQCVQVDKAGLDLGEPYILDETTKQYNHAGNMTYFLERHYDTATNKLADYDKQLYFYDDDQNEIGYEMYKPNRAAGTGWLASSKAEYVRNAAGKVVDQITMRGQNTSDNDWVNNTRFTYAYDQDTILVDKKSYFFSGEEWTPSWGEGNEFDYSVPVENLLLWPGGTFYHKQLVTYSYSGNGTGWDYSSFIYHYSALGSSSVGRIDAANPDNVSLRYSDGMLYITADGDVRVNIYNIAGAKAMTTASKTVGMAGLPDGIYVVEVNGHKQKFVKK